MNRDAVLKSLEQEEGFRAQPYVDTRGYWTLGIGRCLETNPLTPTEWHYLLDAQHLAMSISLAGARNLVGIEVDRCIRELSTELHAWLSLPDAVQDVLIEMCYQLGLAKLLKFERMLGLIQIHQYKQAAAAGLDSAWARQTPSRAQRTMQRLANA